MNQPKIKRGTQRADGLFFICYQKSGAEYWATADVLEKCRLSAQAWKAKNKERMLEKQRQYQRANREALNEKRRIKFKENPELYRAYIESQRENFRRNKRAYYRRKPWVKCAEQAVRRSKMQTDKADLEVIKEIYECCARISKCTGVPHHVDHIVPLALGGRHEPSNLQVLPAVLNMRKGYKMPVEAC